MVLDTQGDITLAKKAIEKYNNQSTFALACLAIMEKRFEKALEMLTYYQQTMCLSQNYGLSLGAVHMVLCLQYRCECFIALGRKEEAQKSVKNLDRYHGDSKMIQKLQAKIDKMQFHEGNDKQVKIGTRMKCSNPFCKKA